MKDQTIDRALIALHKQAIAQQTPEIPHIEALLKARGINPPKRYRKPHIRGISRQCFEAVRAGIGDFDDLTDCIAERAPPLPRYCVEDRVRVALQRLQRKGLVVNEGGVWKLDP